jgi:hypothetical protein
LDRKGEGIRILLDVVDFPLGTINNESIGMPIMDEYYECFHPKRASMVSNPLVDTMM